VRFHKPTLAKVIAFAVVCIIFTVALGVRLANKPLFVDLATYEAEFENAAGMIKGDAVKVAGVTVGRVEDARIEDGKAVVTFTVDRAVEVTEDTRAAIRWRNVLGQRFLYLYPGTGGDRLPDGDRIPVAQTEKAGDIGELLNNLGPILRAIDPDKANAFLDSVNTALIGNEATARQLLDHGAALAGDLGEMDEQIASTVDSADEILAVFARQNQALDSILDDLDTVGGSLQRTTGDLNTVIRDFAVVQKHLNALLTDNREQIDSSIASLDTVAKTLAANRDNLEQTLCTLPRGVSGYWQTTSWGEFFNVRITEVVIKDSESNTLVRQRESSSRQKDPHKTVTGCGDAWDEGGAGSWGEGTVPIPQLSEGLEGVVRFMLLTGEGDA
jgi:phospholipid/cholesterol/gamma-HCH transport system substrate-binding protein